ncbi:dihydrolipoamide acetyltransferase family protein [Microbacterium sp.]|uniref:dihydrolipoamide acetyltransferase family protein n=1 Tax=Microbacterium sp. TaxID=51671 RepID=UPI003A890D18
MIAQFRLPDLGEGLPEAEIVRWHVVPGDDVALNQTIAEVETAKAVVELPSPYAGVVQRLEHEAGATVSVGEVLIVFEVADEPVSADDPHPNLVGYGAAAHSAERPRRRARRRGGPAAVDASCPRRAALPEHGDSPHRPATTPPVRVLAKQLGVDLTTVTPTGGAGLISRADVERAARAADPALAPAAPASVSAEPAPARTPIRGLRRRTADAVTRSAFTAPHVTMFHTIDVTATLHLIDALRDDARLSRHRIGLLAVVAKVTCGALPQHPALNSQWDQEHGQIVHHRDVNLGIAVSTERGLLVPHIPAAQRMSLTELSDALGALTRSAREGTVSPRHLTGGTFSITNFGVFGIEAGTPILNPPEAGILGVGAVARRPWEHRGKVKLRSVMTLSLSFDHRLIDGEGGAAFLRDVGDVLENPARALVR